MGSKSHTFTVAIITGDETWLDSYDPKVGKGQKKAKT